VNARELRDELVRAGSIFQTSSDTEVVLHLYARSKEPSVEEALVESVAQLSGAFSLVMLTKNRLIAARDPHGFRPLALGRLGDAWIVCSETCALDLIGATYVRDIEPGELLVISDGGLRSIRPFPPAPLAHCVFEHVYFARPDSYVFGSSVNDIRTELGRVLAREAPADADVVVPIPDSGVCAAVGFAEESGLSLQIGLIRNHYIGRTFIQPQQAIRHFGVKVKLNPVGASSRASVWCCWTTRSSAARRAARSSRWSRRPARARCTCASAARRQSPRASTGSTRQAGRS
jgi:amidophosphoribosyltransferase